MLFPIAGVELHPVVPPAIGLTIGILSGLFGVGGGFLVTPALVWAGVPPAVAVGTGLNQMVAASSSGTLLSARLGNVSARLGALVAAGGIISGLAGSFLVRNLLREGAFGGVLRAAYVVVLVAVGAVMILGRDGRRAPDDVSAADPTAPPPVRGVLAFGLGAAAGVLSAFLGVGGGVWADEARTNVTRTRMRQAPRMRRPLHPRMPTRVPLPPVSLSRRVAMSITPPFPQAPKHRRD